MARDRLSTIGRCDGTGIEPTKIDIASRKIGPGRWQYQCPKCNRWIGVNRWDQLVYHKRWDRKGNVLT